MTHNFFHAFEEHFGKKYAFIFLQSVMEQVTEIIKRTDLT